MMPQYSGAPVVLLHLASPSAPWLTLCSGSEFASPRIGGFSGEYPQVTCPLCQYLALQDVSAG
jgi:hypothetical protein